MPASTFDFLFSVIGPVLVLLMLGYALYHRGMLSDGFVESGSKLVFNAALPALLFIAISQADISQTANPTLLMVGIAGTLGFFIVLFVLSHFTVRHNAAKGVVIQGGFRANMGIIGLAYCHSTYGQQGLAVASVYLGCITLLFNLLSVFILNWYQPGRAGLAPQLKGIVTNPLILAIVAALPFSFYQIPLPGLVMQSGEYLAQLTLPLALLCTGAALQFRSFGADWYPITLGIISKCLLYPLTIVMLSVLVGIRGMELGVVFLLSVAPTAAASYVMARNLGGDHRLAASIIVTTTLMSLPVTAVAFGLLQGSGLLTAAP